MSTAPTPSPTPWPTLASALAQAGLTDTDTATDSTLGGRSFLEQVLGDPALDAVLTRKALATLPAWQAAMPAADLPAIDGAALQAELDAFAALAHGTHGQAPWTDAQHKGWQRASIALMTSALAQPAVPLHGDFTLARLSGSAQHTGVSGFGTPRLGPLTWDLATLLRDARRPLDEATELDHAIRYWDALRHGGLPLGEPWDSDFGEFWRACEWVAMLRHLGQLGRTLAAPQADPAGDTVALVEWGTRVAMRYRPLQPLVSLIEPWTGARLASGFTF